LLAQMLPGDTGAALGAAGDQAGGGRDLLNRAGDFFGCWGDIITGGGTSKIRRVIAGAFFGVDGDLVDHTSDACTVGHAVGIVHGIVTVVVGVLPPIPLTGGGAAAAGGAAAGGAGSQVLFRALSDSEAMLIQEAGGAVATNNAGGGSITIQNQTRVFTADAWPRIKAFFDMQNADNPGTYTQVVGFQLSHPIELGAESPMSTYAVSVNDLNDALDSFSFTPLDQFGQ
jgi:hypothetical protein